ncbi:polyprenyl synthetase family protein [Streptomyces chrestomyceticus]|uniref:polyprenyl synthetase family protein n=1 Tax=Streptomyces chrestomyceticus TaxID=68185 RepID=UPI0036AF0F90
MIDNSSQWAASKPPPTPGDAQVRRPLPHPSAALEQWSVHARLRDETGGEYALAVVVLRLEVAGDRTASDGYGVLHILTELATGRRLMRSWVQPHVWRSVRSAVGSDQALDARVRDAFLAASDEETPMYPHRLLRHPVTTAQDRLQLSVGDLLELEALDTSYRLAVRDGIEVSLALEPLKPAIDHCPPLSGRAFENSGEPVELNATCVPRLNVTGTLRLPDAAPVRVSGLGWLEHSWGSSWDRGTRSARGLDFTALRVALHLDNGYDVITVETGWCDPGGDGPLASEAVAVVVAPDGAVSTHPFTWRAEVSMMSVASLRTYPTSGELSISEADLTLSVRTVSEQQEVIAPSPGWALWAGPACAQGALGGHAVTAVGCLEALQSATITDFARYMRRISTLVRTEANLIYPSNDNEGSHTLARLTGIGEDGGPALDAGSRQRLRTVLEAPVRHLLDNAGHTWRSYAVTAAMCMLGSDPEPCRALGAVPEILHTASLIIDDIEDAAPLRRGRPAAHRVFGLPLTLNAATAAYFTFDPLLQRLPGLSDHTRLRLYRLCLSALRTGHAGQALDIAGHHDALDDAVRTGDCDPLLQRVRTVHRLKSGMPLRRLVEAAALLTGADERLVHAVGGYFEAVGTSYQISDDISDLRGVSHADRSETAPAKAPAEDLVNGKITLPVAHALARLAPPERNTLARALRTGVSPAAAQDLAQQIIGSGAVAVCLDESRNLVERSWNPLDDLLPPTLHKALCLALGWYASQHETERLRGPRP